MLGRWGEWDPSRERNPMRSNLRDAITEPAAPEIAPGSAKVAGAIEALAARQHGVVARSQLLELGLSSAAIGRRVAAGWLRPLHRGVYRIGPLDGVRAGEMAAVLAAGPSAMLSHTSALRAWKLIGAGPLRPFHVTLLGGQVRRRPGIVFHHARTLGDTERTVLDGVPITSPVRTLVDGAGMLGSRELAKAIASAERLSLVAPAELAELAERYRGRRGMTLLRTLIGADSDRAFTRSEAEERCLALIRRAGLPSPHTNVPVGPYELDFFWPDANVAVEVDGWAFHGTRSRFENDRRKDNWLRGRGIEVVRLTWRQITREPVASAVQVGQALALARARVRHREPLKQPPGGVTERGGGAR
jgi:very-short-patch-repair endonuclease